MNFKWQKYNTQRDEIIQKLIHEVTQLQRQVKDSETQGKLVPHETQVEMNRVLDESRRAMKELEDAKRQMTRLSGERDRVSYPVKCLRSLLISVFYN